MGPGWVGVGSGLGRGWAREWKELGEERSGQGVRARDLEQLEPPALATREPLDPLRPPALREIELAEELRCAPLMRLGAIAIVRLRHGLADKVKHALIWREDDPLLFVMSDHHRLASMYSSAREW